MNKTIAIYGVQVLLGVVALASGYAKLSGMDIMVHQFQVLGLGQGFLLVAGSAEILAGLCLLMPRGGIVGAVVLSCVMIGAVGMTIGHVASAVAMPAQASHFTVSNFQAVGKSGSFDRGQPVIVRQQSQLSI
jgi:uncharacterized membrane protein YphA (DoxX/SURF4 family)